MCLDNDLVLSDSTQILKRIWRCWSSVSVFILGICKNTLWQKSLVLVCVCVNPCLVDTHTLQSSPYQWCSHAIWEKTEPCTAIWRQFHIRTLCEHISLAVLVNVNVIVSRCINSIRYLLCISRSPETWGKLLEKCIVIITPVNTESLSKGAHAVAVRYLWCWNVRVETLATHKRIYIGLNTNTQNNK